MTSCTTLPPHEHHQDLYVRVYGIPVQLSKSFDKPKTKQAPLGSFCPANSTHPHLHAALSQLQIFILPATHIQFPKDSSIPAERQLVHPVIDTTACTASNADRPPRDTVSDTCYTLTTSTNHATRLYYLIWLNSYLDRTTRDDLQ